MRAARRLHCRRVNFGNRADDKFKVSLTRAVGAFVHTFDGSDLNGWARVARAQDQFVSEHNGKDSDTSEDERDGGDGGLPAKRGACIVQVPALPAESLCCLLCARAESPALLQNGPSFSVQLQVADRVNPTVSWHSQGNPGIGFSKNFHIILHRGAFGLGIFL